MNRGTKAGDRRERWRWMGCKVAPWEIVQPTTIFSKIFSDSLRINLPSSIITLYWSGKVIRDITIVDEIICVKFVKDKI